MWNVTVAGQQLAKDFLLLRHILQETPEFASHYRDAALVGPDVFITMMPVFKQYLDTVRGKLDAVTVHQ